MSLDSTRYAVVASAIRELTDVIGSRMFTRQQLLEHSLSDIVARTHSQGQTRSRP